LRVHHHAGTDYGTEEQTFVQAFYGDAEGTAGSCCAKLTNYFMNSEKTARALWCGAVFAMRAGILCGTVEFFL
jgi:hypothetical protein